MPASARAKPNKSFKGRRLRRALNSNVSRMRKEMKGSRIEINLTTYKDISSKEIGCAIYNSLCGLSASLSPELISWSEPVNYPVTNLEKWLDFWGAPASISANGTTTSFKIAPMWRRKKSVQYSGIASFNEGKREDSTISMAFKWNPSINWELLFDNFCEITSPSYGMLHLFTESELNTFPNKTPYLSCGEGTFVNFISPDGNIRKPDSWDKVSRRRYRYLPDLAWKNHFGSEFFHFFNSEGVNFSNYKCREDENHILMKITDSIHDIHSEHEIFIKNKARAKNIFPAYFFRAYG